LIRICFGAVEGRSDLTNVCVNPFQLEALRQSNTLRKLEFYSERCTERKYTSMLENYSFFGSVKNLIQGEIEGKGGKVCPSLGEEANNREKAREVYCPQDY